MAAVRFEKAGVGPGRGCVFIESGARRGASRLLWMHSAGPVETSKSQRQKYVGKKGTVGTGFQG